MPTFALIPGLLSDQIVWEDLAGALFGKGEVHHADLRPYSTISEMARSVLDQTHGPLIPIGHSMGARAALEIARMAPERVPALVLADTGMHPLKPGELEKREEKIRLGHESMEKLADAWLPPMVSEKHHGDQRLMGALRAMVLRADADQHERHLRALISRPDAARYIPNIKCPVLLVVGDEDQWSPVSQHEEIAALLSDCTLEVIKGAGHFAPIERASHVTSIIASWLEQKNRIANENA